jgi:hypothetical protein
VNPSWTGLLIGIVGLAVLDGVVSRPGAASNVGGWLSGAGSAVSRFLDPTIPLFGPASGASTASSTGTPSVQLIATAPTTTSLSPPPSTYVPGGPNPGFV